MPEFTYKGQREDGTPVTGTVTAPDRFAVYEFAREKKQIVFEVEETSQKSFTRFFNIQSFLHIFSRVKVDELTLFTRNLASMLNAGLALSRALSVLERQTKNPKMAKVTTSLRTQVDSGKQFHETLEGFPNVFSKLFVAMAKAGEESGRLPSALFTLNTQLERASNLQKKIRGAMIYPIIILVVMSTIGVLMMIYVVPTITVTFKSLSVELPLSTRILIGISDFLTQSAALAFWGLVLGVASLIYIGRTKAGKYGIHALLIRFPIIGTIVKETNAARTGRTLSSLLSSGVDVVNALKITEEVLQNVHYKKVLREAALKVEKGDAMSGVFIAHDTLYPVLVGEMMAVGEETGDISKMLLEIADFYEKEVEMKTKDLSTIMEPLLMVFIGGIVGFFAFAMIAPIYSVSDSIG